ncbi:mitochondrial [2Fe-2S] cluster assembly NADPH-ferredoxin reductase Arh1 [Schizosaccharomyces osmophilus]|uniref:NADPH:adrenodoxin oxidoreductase, mitochondrial n=1 Tax=Schizosaccharomyces osmophilus TaxID=2545709 RepID=A0AAE9W804_9SCHI|nr:mitochondrial [2Fe-2S] cluster assembly NADPH-ferredoxin reductase Arh1 [Schizosaccharomyces osmophilus]WBW70572.1 mitochondrial [2Fe-2S] cluster assembly NADPH-ferredoxin reductase Arh1 [Schizosaccharomyces osmophilus]
MSKIWLPLVRRYSTQPSSPVVGILGSGPAAFYTAHRLFRNDPSIKIDMYEATPVPFGLVRYGVAPDHPEVKQVEHKFTEIANNNQFRFLGNIHVGKDLPLSTLSQHYDALVYAYGAPSDKLLNIPGEHLRGVYSARQVVGWYNSDPRHQNVGLSLSRLKDLVVIGQGNVSLDIARIMLSKPEQLSPTDINPLFLQQLCESTLQRLHIVGRRDLSSVSFTIKELRELFSLSSATFLAPEYTSSLQFLSEEALSTFDRARKRLIKLIQSKIQAAQQNPPTSPSQKNPSNFWGLEFGLTPVEILGRNGQVEKVRFQKTETVRNDTTSSSDFVEIPAQAVVRSIGYKSVPIPGMQELGIPFDMTRGVILNDDGHIGPGMYASGWVKNGPVGVIASTMMDSFSTADKLYKDWLAREPFLKGTKAGWDGIRPIVKTPVVTWKDWEAIKNHEIENGLQHESVSEKFRTWDDALRVLHK